MARGVRKMLEGGFSVDETDRTPDDISISRLDIVMYVWAIISHLVDLGIDLNVAVRYYLGRRLMEFGWTLTFILFPAFVNTAISVRMYSQDKDKSQETVSNTFSKVRCLRILALVLQLAPVLRLVDALSYAIRSRSAAEPATKRRYYRLMLKEESDAGLLRAVECFLEAAPQQLLQLSLLYRYMEPYTLHQSLSIGSSVLSMAWCLAAYQRAIRFAQDDKRNMSWLGSCCQILWHFLVTLSRVVALSAVIYLFPEYSLTAIFCHIAVMAAWLLFFDRSPFCSHNILAQTAFSFVMGCIYVFTYILPVEGKTRYRYSMYYVLCFFENLICAFIWFLYAEVDNFYYPVLGLSVMPYIFGIFFMVIYYLCFHPKMSKVSDSFKVTIKVKEDSEDGSL